MKAQRQCVYLSTDDNNVLQNILHLIKNILAQPLSSAMKNYVNVLDVALQNILTANVQLVALHGVKNVIIAVFPTIFLASAEENLRVRFVILTMLTPS